MQDMDPQSTRAQFTQVTTPGEPDTANVSNHLPSPSMALGSTLRAPWKW